MITKKKLKEEIITYDIITYKDTREVNIGILANKILEDNLYKE